MLRLALAVVVVLLIGTLALWLPMATVTGERTSLDDAIFTSISAFTGTGLVVHDTLDHWSFFGQLVILVLVTLGGVGVMASTAIVLIVAGRRADLQSRLMITGVAGVRLSESRAVVLRTVMFAAGVTLAGTIALAVLSFLDKGGDLVSALWWGLFHATSAFNNAGFDLSGGFHGMTPYATDTPVLLVLMALMVIGSLGLVVCADVWRASLGPRMLAPESRLVIGTSVALIAIGTAWMLIAESANPRTLGDLGVVDRVLNALFTSISARSTGYDTIGTAELRPETLTMLTMLMFIGGAVGSTAGGIRVNTVAVLGAIVVGTVRRRREPTALGRRVEPGTVHAAVTVLLVSVLVVVGGVVLVQMLSTAPAAARGAVAFETVSAFGTVGLSVGVSTAAGPWAEVAIAACMLIGRLSILGLAIMFARGYATGHGRAPRGSIHVA